jgi:hypothetical protein
MIVKDKFELVYGRSGDLDNILNLSTSTLKKYELKKSDLEHLKSIAKMYGESRNHFASKIINKQVEKCKVVNLDNYPLAGFTTNSNIPYVNINSISTKLISDFAPADVYALFLNTIALSAFIKKKPFSNNVEEHISSFIFVVFMRIFGKKAGLVGSYKHLIPRLRFLVYLYVHTSMFGLKNNEQERKKLALLTQLTDLDKLKLDYDFKSTKQFLKAINENRIIPISENLFSSRIIRLGGTDILPIFEDLSRLFAIFIASTTSGNTVFGSYLPKIRSDLFEKIVYIGSKNLQRIN